MMCRTLVKAGASRYLPQGVAREAPSLPRGGRPPSSSPTWPQVARRSTWRRLTAASAAYAKSAMRPLRTRDRDPQVDREGPLEQRGAGVAGALARDGRSTSSTIYDKLEVTIAVRAVTEVSPRVIEV